MPTISKCSEMLQQDDFPTRGLLQMRVRVVCTTDDPLDSLEHHKKPRRGYHLSRVRVLPAFRPDGPWR